MDYNYPSGTAALAGMDLHVREGKTVGLVGPSGCGKSTFLRLSVGFVTPTAGRLDIAAYRAIEESCALQCPVSMLFQNATTLPWLWAAGR